MYLVSACLAGKKCRYDGTACENKVIAELVRRGKAVAVCPEQLGGLPTPRPCCELDKNRRIKSSEGRDLTAEYEKGAQKALEKAKANGVTVAILKSRSPSCGCGIIYDGTFTGKKTEGNGLAAELLLKSGITVLTENDLDKL